MWEKENMLVTGTLSFSHNVLQSVQIKTHFSCLRICHLQIIAYGGLFYGATKKESANFHSRSCKHHSSSFNNLLLSISLNFLMGGLVRGRLLIWGDAMCLRARIRSFKPPQLHFLPLYHNLEVDKDCLVTQFCLFCIVTSLKILASYTLLPLLMYSCKFQLRNSIFIILYTITCVLNDQSCRCAIKQHSFIHSCKLL